MQLKTGQTTLGEGVIVQKILEAPKGPLKGVSERIEEFVTEEDNLGEDTMNPKKYMLTTR